MKKMLVSSLACLLLAGMLYGCVSSPTSPNRSKDLPMTITGSMFAPTVLETTGLKKPSSDNTFLALKVKVENRMDKDVSVGASEFGVNYNSQRYENKYLMDLGNDQRFDGNEFGSGVIITKSSIEGWMVFDVPKGIQTAPKAELRFTDVALFGGGQYSTTDFIPSQIKQFTTNSERLTVEAKAITVTYKFTDDNNAVKVSSKDQLFAVCDLKISNNAKKVCYLYTATIVLTTADDNDYTMNNMYDPKDNLASQNIPPVTTVRGALVFDMPSDDTDISTVSVQYSKEEIYSCSVPESRITTAVNTAPAAVITAEDKGFIETDIDFDGTSSSDPDRDPLTYSWDFGDPKVTSDTSTKSKDTYEYTAPGKYVVKLKVRDVGGLESQTTFEIEIKHFFSLAALNHGIETDDAHYHEGDFFVDVKLTNNADETKSVYSTDFQIKTSDGAMYDWGGDDGNDPSSLGAGASASWRVYFKVPQGKTPTQVIFDDTLTCNL